MSEEFVPRITWPHNLKELYRRERECRQAGLEEAADACLERIEWVKDKHRVPK